MVSAGVSSPSEDAMKAARRPRAARGILLAALCAAGTAVRADEDKDIELIPQAPPQAPAEQTSDPRRRIFVENAFTLWGLRNDLEVPFPPPEPPHWQERLLLDARKEWQPTARPRLALPGRP